MAGELGDLLTNALQHPVIKATSRQTEAAQLLADAAAGRYYGSANLFAGLHTYEDKRVVGVFAPGRTLASLTSDNIGQVGVNYSLPVDIFGVIAANKERAQHDVRAAELLGRQQRLMKLHQAANGYVTLQSLAKQREALNLSSKRIEATYQRVRKEFELGKASGVDFRYAESEVARLNADKAVLDGVTAQVQSDIAEATGAVNFIPTVSDIRIPTWDTASDVSLLVLIAKTKQQSAQAQAEESRRSLLPSISLDANYSYNSDIAGDHRNNWAIGGVINIPLGVSQYRQVSAQRVVADAAAEQTEAAIRDSDRQLVSLHSAYESARADAIAMEKEVTYREEIAHVQQNMQQLGNQTLENLFKHERDLLDARFRLTQAQARAAAAWSAAQIVTGLPIETYISRMDAQ
jgi:outer membrane protein TolC